jgi:membrane protease YdiL (CAAX protease family)
LKLSIINNISSYPAPARLGLFILTLLIFWLPFAVPIYLFLNKNDPNLTTILTMGLLFICFIIVVIFWGRYVYNKQNLFKVYGLITNQRNLKYLLKGLTIGFSLTWLLFILEGAFGWLTFQSANNSLIKLTIEGFISALAIGFGEELLFRGWLLDELERDYNSKLALWIDGLVFATLHFLKPLEEVIRTFVTFPALILLGLTLVCAKRAHNNLLGICIGIHSGLVWGYYILNVGQMLQYTNKVPTWITGIDQNPIAGVMGLLFLSCLLVWMRIMNNEQ